MLRMSNNRLLFPIQKPTYQDALASLEELKNLDSGSLVQEGVWYSRSEIDYGAIDKYITINKSGSKYSNHFHWGYRMACDSLNSPSALRSWYNPKIRKSVESCKFFEDSPATALALRKYIPSQFRPSAAKTIYEMFNAKRIYDPSGGWGDRLLGAAVLDDLELYYTRDINTLVFGGYTEQIKDLGVDINKFILEHKGCEEDSPSEKNFDITFTSPPYFNAEKYNGNDQSFRKYKKFDAWMEGFLYKTCHNCWDVLKDGGHMIFNISDVYSNHTYNRICNPLIRYCIDNLDNCEYVGTMGYKMGKRLNSKSDTDGVFCEPIIIFKKKII